MGPDRLSPLDTSFLHIEDHVSHMHIASVAIFEGPPPPFADIVAMVDAQARPGPPLPPEGQVRPARARAAGLGGRPALQHRVPPAPHRAAGPRWRERAAQARRSRDGTTTRPVQAVVGDLGRRGARGRTLGHAGQDAPRAGRRRVGHRPVGGHHGPQRRDRNAPTLGVDAPSGALGAAADGGRAREHRALALRAGARRAGAGPRRPQDRGLRTGGRRGPLLPERARTPDTALEPQRSARPPPALRLGHDVGRRDQACAQGARRDLQRRGARQHHQRLP